MGQLYHSAHQETTKSRNRSSTERLFLRRIAVPFHDIIFQYEKHIARHAGYVPIDAARTSGRWMRQPDYNEAG